ncbi:hypothetical protein [Oceanobacillus sp. FSL H7-0719]|uniref:hypothetical protein n=1 Tax=Oceanobacillus sp. FSL H7-0719 TaxID=2954507 RepID=UPI0032512632
MKKILFVLLVSFLLLTGCNEAKDREIREEDNEVIENENMDEEESAVENVENEEEVQEEGFDENTELTLQVTRWDEQSGVTLDSEIYTVINQLLSETPDAGMPNDFSVYTVDIYSSEAGRSLVLLGINRTPVEMTNISFDFSLGSQEEFVLENYPVSLTEEEMGVFSPNGVMPFIIEISDEQAESLLSITQPEVLLSIDNFEFEEME